jgi:Tol biopolymer transport system component
MQRSVVVLLFVAACSSTPQRNNNGNHDGGNNNGGQDGSIQTGPPETHDVVDPSLPMGIVSGFDNTTPQVGGLTMAYPEPGIIIPHDLAQIDAQWNAVPGATAYRVTYAVPDGNRLRGYVTMPSWTPSAGDWQWLMDRAAGHVVTLTVDGGAADMTGKVSNAVGSQPQPVTVSHDDATGALFYFATTGDQISGDGTLERLEVGKQQPDKYLNKSNDGNRCVGCHALTRDGTRLAFDFLDFGGIGGALSLGDVDANNPTMQQAQASQAVAQMTFNPDGTKLLTSYQGKLQLRDGVTGALVMDVTTSGPAMYPDWSADGQHVVFVRPSALCAVGSLPFGQDSIFIYGGALWTLDYSNGAFSNEHALVSPSGNENYYYPSYSPDNQYIAFSRADGSTKSSWSVANSACTGKDGSGLSYDNPSAEVWLVKAAGGAPFALTAANGAPMRTNSWPKWGPKGDGEYLWLSFTSTRPYGNVLSGANAKHQIWITAVQPAAMDVGGGDPSAPAVWFPFQDTTTKNHIGMWSVKVGNYSIM